MKYSLLPRFLQVELTYACNSHCVFCYNPNHLKQHDEEKRIEILKKINSYRISHVQLIGGEITLLKELPKYLDLLDNVEWRSIVTNGRIYVPELKDKVDEIYLSLHGDKEQHESITRAKDSFSVIEDTITSYIKDGITVHSDTCLTSENYFMIYDIAAYASSLGMDTIFVNIFQPAGIGSYSENLLTPTIEQLRFAITQMVEAKKKLPINVSFGTSTPLCLDERLISEYLAFQCGTGDWFASINPDGELRICNQSKKSYGNVLTTPLNEIWHSKSITQDYRNMTWLSEPCNSCVLKNDCLGGCRISDSGTPRIDPLVMKNIDSLLSQEILTGLKEKIKGNVLFT